MSGEQGDEGLSRAQKIFQAARHVDAVRSRATPPPLQPPNLPSPIVEATLPDTPPGTAQKTAKPTMTQEKLEEVLDAVLHHKVTTSGDSTVLADIRKTHSAHRIGRRPRWAGHLGR